MSDTCAPRTRGRHGWNPATIKERLMLGVIVLGAICVAVFLKTRGA